MNWTTSNQSCKSENASPLPLFIVTRTRWVSNLRNFLKLHFSLGLKFLSSNCCLDCGSSPCSSRLFLLHVTVQFGSREWSETFSRHIMIYGLDFLGVFQRRGCSHAKWTKFSTLHLLTHTLNIINTCSWKRKLNVLVIPFIHTFIHTQPHEPYHSQTKLNWTHWTNLSGVRSIPVFQTVFCGIVCHEILSPLPQIIIRQIF